MPKAILSKTFQGIDIPDPAPEKEDTKNIQQARHDLHREKELIECKRLRQELEGLIQEHNLREEFAKKIKNLTYEWIFFIAAVIAINLVFQGGRLSDPVLIALIGGTSVNIIGLMWVVANNLFPSKEKYKKPKE